MVRAGPGYGDTKKGLQREERRRDSERGGKEQKGAPKAHNPES